MRWRHRRKNYEKYKTKILEDLKINILEDKLINITWNGQMIRMNKERIQKGLNMKLQRKHAR
jgi:hypothetical protein